MKSYEELEFAVFVKRLARWLISENYFTDIKVSRIRAVKILGDNYGLFEAMKKVEKMFSNNGYGEIIQ